MVDDFIHSGIRATDREIAKIKSLLRYGDPLRYVSCRDMARAQESRELGAAMIDTLARERYGLTDLGHMRDLRDGEVCRNRWGMAADGEFVAISIMPHGWEKTDAPASKDVTP